MLDNKHIKHVTLIGIDPGSNTLGVAIMHIEPLTWGIISTHAKTFVGTRLSSTDEWTTEVYGDRLGRIFAHEQNLFRIFEETRPLLVASESPFYSQRHPQAFGALTEVICAIRNALRQHDGSKQVFLVDPPTVKRAVGAPGNGDKDRVREAILKLTNLNYVGDIPLIDIDEHSLDAIAVCYHQYISKGTELCLLPFS